MEGHRDPTVSRVELYRRGELEDFPYEMSVPLDVAIWSAMQAYVDLLERLDLAAREEKAARGEEMRVNSVYQYRDTSVLNLRSPGFLETELLNLREWNSGKLVLEPKDRYETASHLLEAFFSPARNLSGRLVPWGYGEYHVDRTLWETGEEILEGKRETGVGGGLLKLPQWDAAHHFRTQLAPLYAMLIRSLGGLVSQAEVARRLGLSPRGIALRITRGEMRHIRVGGSVLVPEEDVEMLGGERPGLKGRAT